jgi:medium-chain acyl-[acyl-carrier-protein] hydrolase
MEALVDALGPVLANHDDLPYAIFGYSFGALVAFELARWMRRHRRRGPQRLLLASLVAPQILAKARLQLHTLPDEELIEQVGLRYAEMPPALLHDGAMRAIILRTLRSDMACIETYEYAPADPLDVPIDVYVGDRDRATPRALLEGWKHQSRRAVGLHLLSGGHFVFETSSRERVAALGRTLLSGEA